MKVNKKMCATCPWRRNSPYAYLRGQLAISALSHASRICHNTGTNAINTTTKAEKICRGARNEQLQVLHGIGLLDAPTDKAWVRKCRRMGIVPDGIKRTGND